MKQIVGIIVILLLSISTTHAVVPTDEWKAEDELQVDQKNKDKKIWKNMLAVYDGARKIAKGSLEIMENVSKYAYTAQKYLNAIERTATRAQIIWSNIKDIKQFVEFTDGDKKKSFFKRVKDLHGRIVDVIEYTEEDIFQQSDALFYQDIPSLKQARKEMYEQQQRLLDSPKEVIDRLRKNARDFDGYEKKYAKLAAVGSTDGSVYSNANAAVKRHMISQGDAINAIAIADQRAMDIDNDAAAAVLSLHSAENDSALNTADLTKNAMIAERNKLVLYLKEHDVMHDAVRTSAQLLLSKIVPVDQRIAEKTSFIGVAERFSDALIEQKAKDAAEKHKGN
jgi:hypothetical protein